MKLKGYLIVFVFASVMGILTAYTYTGNLRFYTIPQQKLDLYGLLGDTSKKAYYVVKNTEISDFVTFKEYKQYLFAVKRDSSEKFYLTQLPDTSITIDKSAYAKYITESIYDNYPVVGISWDNAMNFCKWKTLRDNLRSNVQFVYRLPNCSEWLAAYYYLEENKIENDFNKNYSDWLLNTKVDKQDFIPNMVTFTDKDEKETAYFFKYDKVFMFYSKISSSFLPDKCVLGNSFLYQKPVLKNHFYYRYLSNKGYKHIGFRLVKDYFATSQIADGESKTLAQAIYDYWNINYDYWNINKK